MNLERLLTTPKLVEQAPHADEVRKRAELVSPNPIKLFYGETYDEKGNTIDSMKYYFFVANLADALRVDGFTVDPAILIADSAACRNVGKDKQAHYMYLGNERVKFVERVNEIYGTGLRIIKMSDFIDSEEFVRKREQIKAICAQDPELMEAVEKTVPESKLSIERGKDFLYSFDEITTIIDLDIKVGPPREDLYDNVARTITEHRDQKGLISLFLSPTFPIGVNWSYFFVNEGIENHGITAYKAASKGLARNRVIIGQSNPDDIKNLINNTFLSQDPALPNPILDIGIISEMARKRLEDDATQITLASDFYEGKLTPDMLKGKVGQEVNEYILSMF